MDLKCILENSKDQDSNKSIILYEKMGVSMLGE